MKCGGYRSTLGLVEVSTEAAIWSPPVSLHLWRSLALSPSVNNINIKGRNESEQMSDRSQRGSNTTLDIYILVCWQALAFCNSQLKSIYPLQPYMPYLRCFVIFRGREKKNAKIPYWLKTHQMSVRIAHKNEVIFFALSQTTVNQRDGTVNSDILQLYNMHVELWPRWFTFPERVSLILMEPSILAAINSSLHEVVPLLAAFLRWSTHSAL